MSRPNCIITGASGGIGSALALHMADRGYDLILHSRTIASLKPLLKIIDTGQFDIHVSTIAANLDTSHSVCQLGDQLSQMTPKLNILFNCAGVLLDGIHLSKDGMDMHTQINLLAPYILMQKLKPNVSLTQGTILNIASGSALGVKQLDIQRLIKPTKAVKLFGTYAESKLALALITETLAQQFMNDGVRLACAAPGPTKTTMTSGAGMPKFLLWLRPFLYSSPEQSAARIYLAYQTAQSYSTRGQFFSGKRVKPLPRFLYQSPIAEQLIDFCQSYIDT